MRHPWEGEPSRRNHSSTRFIHGVVFPISPYKYLSKGHVIRIAFLAWQFDHPGIACYIASCGCLMVPSIVELQCIVQIWDIETSFVVYTYRAGCNKLIDAIRIKWPEPVLDRPPVISKQTCVVATTTGSSATEPDIIDNFYSLNGTWTEYIQCSSRITQEQVPQGLIHCGWHGRVKVHLN